jgi:hypothetical protein
MKENLMGNPPLRIQCIKKEEEGRKEISKKPCPSPQDDHTEGGTSTQ